jgi:hypothetical protein
MTKVVHVRIDWDHTAIPMRHDFFTLRMGPSDDYPFGQKGHVLLRAWEQLASDGTSGMLILDGDVAIDPEDLQAMHNCIDMDPLSVWTAPVKIWPISTHREEWTWGHWAEGKPNQDILDSPDFFTFCFTYLPLELINDCKEAGMDGWTYPNVDRWTSLTASSTRMTIRVADNCWPKHLNY